jgi:uncharacterized SAM-binding protein YcdF (DUF218 family)
MKITAGNIILRIAACMLMALLVLYFDFAKEAGRYKAENNRADAIVVLTGGLGRVDKGFELFAEGKAGCLILAGVAKDATLESIFFKRDLVKDKVNIILEKNSTSTYENAVEIEKIIKTKNINSIILITSFYHMKRALYTFNRILPGETRLYIYPVTTPNFDENMWWRGSGLVLMAGEFFKYYWYILQL